MKLANLPAKLLKAGASSAAIKIIALFISLLLSVTLARWLGPDQFGLYSFAFSIAAILAIPAQLGLPNLVIRETAKSKASSDWARMAGIWRWANRYALTSAAILCVSVGMAVPFAPILKDNPTIYWLSLAIVPVIALGNLRGASMRGLKAIILGLLPEQVIRPIILIVLCLLLLPSGTLDATSAMAAHLAAAAIAFVVGAILLHIKQPPEIKKAVPEYKSKAWRVSLISLSAIAGLQMIMQQTDILLIGIMRPIEEVAYYKIAVQGASLVAFGLTAVNLIAAPYLASSHEKNDMAQMQKIAKLGALGALSVALPMLVAFVFFGEPLVSLIFGAEYEAAALPLMILAFGQVVNATTGLVGLMLAMSNNEARAAKTLAAAAFVNIVLNLILIPVWGIAGAAAATAISVAINNILLWVQVRKHLGIDGSAFFSPRRAPSGGAL